MGKTPNILGIERNGNCVLMGYEWDDYGIYSDLMGRLWNGNSSFESEVWENPFLMCMSGGNNEMATERWTLKKKTDAP